MIRNQVEFSAETQPETNLPILVTGSSDKLDTCSLVLSAAGIRHNISANSYAAWEIHVDSRDRHYAVFQLSAYEEENQNWPTPSAKEDSFTPIFHAQSFLLSISLALFFSVTGDWTPHSEWFTHGAVDSTAILENHEFYRLITGLTLHADIVHMLSNCLLGGFLMHFYFQILGNGIGICALLLSSILANYLNVIGHGNGHLAVGFSTAVFSIIGILSALNFRHYKFSRPARLVLPIMAGAALLAMLGSSGERTDLGAHFFGLLTGLATGTTLGIKSIFLARKRFWLQLILGVFGLLLPVLAWIIASQ